MSTHPDHPLETVPTLEVGELAAADRKTASRRSFLFLGALAAVGLKPSRAAAQKSTRAPSPIGTRFQTVQQQETPSAPLTWRDSTARLLRRATYGPTITDLASAKTMGYQAWLAQQLKPSRINDSVVDLQIATQYPTIAGTPDTLYQIESTTVANTLQQATIIRAAFSQRQLFERMVEFWSDHFNIYVQKVGYLKIIDDREVIRKHALGRFVDLLKASATSPAMLAYLDQTQSRVGRPNENYAREVMELHTLGVDGGYTQTDVAELARVLTGWTIKGRGDFSFDPTGHDWTAKTVMGVTIPAGSPSQGQDGMKEGLKILDMLAAHPNTAKFISTKMLRWLLNSEPTATQISVVSGVFRSTGGDIPSMVRAILNDAWVSASPARYKRPFHYLVSSVRALNAAVTIATTLGTQLNNLGQPLFLWETPDGYPDSVEYWSGNITPRWNFANVMASFRAAPVTVDSAPFMTAGVDGAIDAIDKRLFAGEISPSSKAALRAYLASGTFNDARVRETIGLALSTSDFQWY